MRRNPVHGINDAEAQEQKHSVFYQMAQGGSITINVHQIGTGAVHRQKREKRQEGHYAPNGFITFQIFEYSQHVLQVFYCVFKLIPSILIIFEKVETCACW